MAGQGKTTRLYASGLTAGGWNILFVCIPNTPHVKVVPIPTSHGVSKQRYPDIAAVKNGCLLFVEIEMSLSAAVVEDIGLRFREMRQALASPDIYRAWRNKVELVSGHVLPETPIFETRLKLVNEADMRSHQLVSQLESQDIVIVRD
jgi:hypothetical protein